MSGCFYCGSKCRATAVYVISEVDGRATVKVGYSGNPVKRLAQLRKQTGRDLTILHRSDIACEFKAMDIEEASHGALRPHWSGRGEWFECSAEVAIGAVEVARKRLGSKGKRP